MSDVIQISAVIPTYNRGPIVCKAIDSILAQTYAPAEIIVIDDGSTDNTRQWVKKYERRVRYVYQENHGVSAARNRGVNESRFEWIAFLDSDDQWVPEHLERIVDAMENTSREAALYFADVRPADRNPFNTYWQRCGLNLSGQYELKHDASPWAFMSIQPMLLQASVIRREAYLKVGALPEQMRTREDTLLFFKLALFYPVCAVAGCGTVMNAADTIRLTQLYDSGSLTYCHATSLIFRELLSGSQHITKEQRRDLIDRLSISYLSAARVLLRQDRYVAALKNLSTSCSISPNMFAREMARSIIRHIF